MKAKLIKMVPIKDWFGDVVDHWPVCPECDMRILENDVPVCPWCGQELLWRIDDE